MSAHVITNVRIFDGSGRDPYAGEVIVEGNRISGIRGYGSAPPNYPTHGSAHAADTRYIDGRGAFLMPGLVEAHAHLSFTDMTSMDLTRLPIEEHMLATVRNARTMLDCGYTSAFSAASANTRLDVVEIGRASCRERV